MRILAVDPSLRSTGLAGAGWSEAVNTKGMTGHQRLAYIEQVVYDYLQGVTLVVMEGPAYGARGRSVHQLAGLWWQLAHMFWTSTIPYAVVDPRTLKMYATGNGNASKEDVARAMADMHPSRTFATNDESDAYALLTMAHHHYHGFMGCCGGHFAVPGHDRTTKALENVEWPEI